MRASIVTELLGGVALPSGVLAARAGVSSSAVSNHLGHLLEGGIVTVTRQGRARLFELASSDVARVVETFQAIVPDAPSRSYRSASNNQQLRWARSCYDHLAGQMAVLVVDRLAEIGWLVLDASRRIIDLSKEGESGLRSLGISSMSRENSRRPFVLGCNDWTERREHLAGSSGAALLAGMLEQNWVGRRSQNRSLVITDHGRRQLVSLLGLSLD